MSIFTHIHKAKKRKGIFHVFKSALPFIYSRGIRGFLPHSGGEVVFNGIKVAERRLFDRTLPEYVTSFCPPVEDKPEYKKQNISQLRTFVRDGDTVVVIGGGYGVTTAVAANQVGENGHVYVFEGGKERIAQIMRTLKLNDLSNRCEITHGIVGPGKSVMGQMTDATQIPPEDLPKCDVMELDCEGAELQILKNIRSYPQTIIVETHPNNGAQTEAVRKTLLNLGYRIVEQEPDPVAGHVLIARCADYNSQ